MYSFKRSLLAFVGLLILVGLLAVLMPLVSRGQGGNPHTRDPRKSYYLTQTQHNGSQALSACAAGYHMASLWEIFNTANLSYNTELGLTTADSGFGPPSGSSINGWIRTGNEASPASGALGQLNCNAWTSAAGADGGTIAGLSIFWTTGAVSLISPWSAGPATCPTPRNVWCVQD